MRILVPSSDSSTTRFFSDLPTRQKRRSVFRGGDNDGNNNIGGHNFPIEIHSSPEMAPPSHAEHSRKELYFDLVSDEQEQEQAVQVKEEKSRKRERTRSKTRTELEVRIDSKMAKEFGCNEEYFSKRGIEVRNPRHGGPPSFWDRWSCKVQGCHASAYIEVSCRDRSKAKILGPVKLKGVHSHPISKVPVSSSSKKVPRELREQIHDKLRNGKLFQKGIFCNHSSQAFILFIFFSFFRRQTK